MLSRLTGLLSLRHPLPQCSLEIERMKLNSCTTIHGGLGIYFLPPCPSWCHFSPHAGSLSPQHRPRVAPCPQAAFPRPLPDKDRALSPSHNPQPVQATQRAADGSKTPPISPRAAKPGRGTRLGSGLPTQRGAAAGPAAAMSGGAGRGR